MIVLVSKDMCFQIESVCLRALLTPFLILKI